MIISYKSVRYRARLAWDAVGTIWSALTGGTAPVSVAPAFVTADSFLDTDILTQIQYHLVETPDGGDTWGSGLWDVPEVITYLNNRQRRLLAETGALLVRSDIITTPNTFRHDLPQGWIATTRVTWRNPNEVKYTLPKVDTWEAAHNLESNTYNTAARPKVYNDSGAPPLQIEIYPASYDMGVLEILYAAVGETLTNRGVAFSVPDEFVWIIKWGVMADMLYKIGRGQDIERAQYCEGRFKMGVEFIRLMLGEENG